MGQLQSLAQKLPYAASVAEKRKKKKIGTERFIIYKIRLDKIRGIPENTGPMKYFMKVKMDGKRE